MRKSLVLFAILLPVILLVSFQRESLRDQYAKDPSQWPAPWVDSTVQWKELGALPESPLAAKADSLRAVIELGKILFFDPRLSASDTISCASCHQPEKYWTDGVKRSIGHEGAVNKRNSPTIANSWHIKRPFWDGRARNLQDQAFAPIISESEMGSDMPVVMMKLRRISGYKELFKKAFGDEHIDPDRMTGAIALFEQTVVSRPSPFDLFLQGDRNALSNSELRGLHLFRTKARCMNCHNGPLFTDNSFHQIGFSGTDAGYYKVTHQDADSGKFRTPSLRDVMHTGPWMHDGEQDNMTKIIQALNTADGPGKKSGLLKPLGLNTKEKKDLLAFLWALSAPAPEFQRPVLPQ